MKQRAIICDLDGTLIHNPDWDGDLEKFYQNITQGVPIYWCQDLLEKYAKDTTIIFLTARNEKCRHITNCQLRSWFDFKYDLYMRYSTDFREDWEVKQDFILKLKEVYDILFCIDDNPENCTMFRKNGLVALKV